MRFVKGRTSSMSKVEVVYIAEDNRHFLVQVEFQSGMTAEQAIHRSGVLEQFKEIDLNSQAVGVFAKKVDLSQLVKPGDRIEIYRGLKISPMQKRRQRAKK
jgi:putative ubiquitin-RnfH superfamily antitoxin RatB of RatAB toxin-antitoxin module